MMLAMDELQTQPIPTTASAAAAEPGRRWWAPFLTAGRDFVYLLGAFTMSIVGFVVWVTGLR